MLRRTSKNVKQEVDKMCLPAVVHLCELWIEEGRGFQKNCRLQKLQIVMKELPLMTAWCRITTLKLHVLYPSDFDGDQAPETFAGVLEGVLGQCTGSLTHLDLDSNCLGSDGVRRLAEVLTQCTTLRHLGLSSNDLGPAGGGALTGALTHCRALNHLDLHSNDIGTSGAGKLARVLAQCTALAHLDLGDNGIGPGGADKLAQVLGQCPALELVDLSYNSIGSVGNRRLYS